MFAFGSASLSLGRRLWLAGVVICLVLLSAQPPWLAYVQHPLQHPVQLLTVLGEIQFVYFCADWLIVIVASGARDLVRKWQARQRSHVLIDIEYHPDPVAFLLPLCSLFMFTSAVLWAPGLHLPWWAAVAGGLAFLAIHVAELLQDQSLTTYQLAQVDGSEDSELIFLSVQTERDIIATSFQSDWQGATGYLIANGWELVEIRQVDRKSHGRTCWERTARFRRPRPTSAYFSVWHGNLEHYRLGFG